MAPTTKVFLPRAGSAVYLSPRKHGLKPTKKRSFSSVKEEDNSKEEYLKEIGFVYELFPSKKAKKASESDEETYRRREKVAKYADQLRKKKIQAAKVRGDWSQRSASAQRGLANLTGVLCYRHSLFQALLHQPKFVNWLDEYHRPEQCVSESREHCVSCQLRVLSKVYWCQPGHPKSQLSQVLADIDKIFRQRGWKPDAGSGGQGDPEEQVSWILKQIREEVPSEFFAYLEASHLLVTNSVVKCNRCGKESKTEAHTEGGLSVPIQPAIRPKPGSLTAYLQRYMDEVVEDYRCEGCQDKGKKSRTQNIQHAPDILLVQLKRFNWDGSKDSSPVSISVGLDLNRYRDTENKSPLRYELTAVIQHSGSTGFGHYICSAKGPDGKWRCFNDSSVSSTDIAAAVGGNGRNSFTPYMLYFQRKE
ncbi:hypothetical protein F5884DRAFT_866335 [Xylogone sp. PMI_703]|nr:hypothetical protein F5884DRAFT_866335 [Xylogone sp. PMI_703]